MPCFIVDNLLALPKYMELGPTRPPPAPERRIAAVLSISWFDDGVVWLKLLGRCKIPGTAPSETLMVRDWVSDGDLGARATRGWIMDG